MNEPPDGLSARQSEHRIDQSVEEIVEGTAAPESVQRFEESLTYVTPRLWVTPLLIGVNVVVFIVMLANGVSPIEPDAEVVLQWGANFGPKTMNDEWWRLFTCMFLHFGVLHIAFNIWVLWDFGRLVERLLGNVGFLLIYILSGLIASVASLSWDSMVISAGASGAIFGVVGALLGFIAIRQDTIPLDVLRSKRNSTVGFLFFNIIFGLAAEGIDMAAHLGGLVAGFVGGLIMSQPIMPELRTRWPERILLLAMAGIGTVTIGIHLLPHNIAELERYPKVEEKLLMIYNSAVDKVNAEEITNDEFAQIIETQVIPKWRHMLNRLNTVPTLPPNQQRVLDLTLEHLNLQLEGFELRVEGIQAGFLGLFKIAEANNKMQTANEIADKLEAETKNK